MLLNLIVGVRARAIPAERRAVASFTVWGTQHAGSLVELPTSHLLGVASTLQHAKQQLAALGPSAGLIHPTISPGLPGWRWVDPAARSPKVELLMAL